jgi:rhodanese-related sulfurtransferase
MNKEISAVEASNLSDQDKTVTFLDVREQVELEICRIEGAIHIPMGNIPERFEQLPKDKTIIVFCHHGMRSRTVQEYLEAQGFENLINLAGGIHAWAINVDPTIKQY